MAVRSDTSKRRRLLTPPGGGRFAAVIFDMGSTLLEFENIPWPVLYRFCLDEVHRRLVRLGHTPPDPEVFWHRFDELLNRRRRRIAEQMREYQIGPLLRDQARSFEIKLRPGELTRLCDAYYAPVRRAVTMYPDAPEVLATLKRSGYKIGLLSNTCFRARDHLEELRYFGLRQWFDELVFTSTGIYRKPHPEPFRLIARKLGVPLKRCVYVGDRQKEDVLGPQALNMTPILVRRPLRRYVEGMTESVEVDQLSELLGLLPIA
ncbi:MAG: HAD family hydrolase [candidate division Zixibacteria bacterium]|nr:HAD family hydrolase [candidate division Zixibacteria bacterium]